MEARAAASGSRLHAARRIEARSGSDAAQPAGVRMAPTRLRWCCTAARCASEARNKRSRWRAHMGALVRACVLWCSSAGRLDAGGKVRFTAVHADGQG